jgi:hypothetical protein
MIPLSIIFLSPTEYGARADFWLQIKYGDLENNNACARNLTIRWRISLAFFDACVMLGEC